MKRIELTKLHLHNFQCFKDFEIQFSTKLTNISGENGVGKTTIYSAMMWLMFGKDAYNRKDFDVRHIEESVPNYEEDTFVEGEFRINVDGVKQSLKLKRVLHGSTDNDERWHDTTICFINGITKSISEYDAHIDSIVPEETFKILTNVFYFQSLDTKKKREILCEMAGSRSVSDIVSTNPYLSRVIAKKDGDMPLDDYLTLTTTELKNAKDAKKAIQPTIDALTSTLPKEDDWQKLEKEKAAHEAEIRRLNEELAQGGTNQPCSTKIRECEKAVEEARSTLSEIKREEQAEIDAIENEYKKEKDAYKKNTAEVGMLNSEIGFIEAEIDSLNTSLLNMDEELSSLMEKHNSEKATTLSFFCPLISGHECEILKNEKHTEIEARFNKAKEEKLSAIMKEGRAINAKYKAAEVLLKEKKEKLAHKDSQRKVLMEKIAVEPTKRPAKKDYESLKTEATKVITEKEDQLSKAKQLKPSEKETMLSEEYRTVSSLTEKLAAKAHRDSILTTIEEKKKEGKKLADTIVELSTRIDAILQIKRLITLDCEKRINDMFSIVRWQTTEEQKNGSVKDICKAFVNGVSASLNTAKQVNVGIDICDIISRHKGIQVPLFIDNRESVNDILHTDTQVINLIVAPKGTPLTIH